MESHQSLGIDPSVYSEAWVEPGKRNGGLTNQDIRGYVTHFEIDYAAGCDSTSQEVCASAATVVRVMK